MSGGIAFIRGYEGGTGEETIAEGETAVTVGYGIAEERHLYLAPVEAPTNELEIKAHHPAPLLRLTGDDTLIDHIILGQVDAFGIEMMRHEGGAEDQHRQEDDETLHPLHAAQQQGRHQQHRHYPKAWPKGQRQFISEGDASAKRKSDGK